MSDFLKIEEEGDNQSYIYYNLRVSNPIESNEVIPTIYSSTRVDQILDKCSNYKLSVIRFQLPANFPLFIYPSDDSLFQVRLTNGLDTVTKNLTYTQKYETYIERGIYYINHSNFLSFIIVVQRIHFQRTSI